MGKPLIPKNLDELIASYIQDAQVQQAIQQALRSNVQVDTLINDVSASFAHVPLDQIPERVQQIAEHIGKTLDVDRCFVFWIDQATNRLSKVYEWHHADLTPLTAALTNLPLAGFVWSLPTLQRFEPLCIPKVAELPPEAAVEAQQMALHGTQSVICVPFRQSEKLLGWLSLEVVRHEQAWPSEFVMRLQVLADLVGHILNRYETESALKKSETLFRAIVEDQTELICRFLPDGRLTFVNEAYCRYFNKTATELMGRSFMPFIPEEDRLVVEKVFSSLSITNPVITYEHRVGLENGDIRWMEWTDRAIFDEQGAFLEFQAVGRDITKAKEAEIGLKQLNGELATAVAAKDQFLANMSHELRTPLHSILLKAEMLQRGIYAELSDRQKKSISVIEKSGRHLLSLINDILDLSKISAGQEELAITKVDIQVLCRETLQLVRQLAQEKQLKLFFNVDQDVIFIDADELRLKQILVNLLSNSIKFTPSGGRIGLDIVGDVAQGVICLSVWDTGRGIEPEKQARIFEPFAQVNDPFGKREGTGLGLALVKRLVDLHQGTVQVQSVVGEGSQFTIELPWQPVRSATPELTSTASDDLLPDLTYAAVDGETSPLVLLAEDNETLVETLLDFFELQPYDVVVVGNGLQVLDALEQRVPDVILMDVQMPFLNGLETTKRIRSNERFAHIPVVMVTAMAMPGDEKRCFEAGATAYLTKPLNLMQLVDTIEAQLA
ncbi:MAG: ATP-binding protein [Chloroflexota bacterium]